jgi:ActR/RegA family two-component response regulator
MDATAPRHVLIMVEDPQLADLLLDALCEAGHTAALATSESLPAVLASERFDAAIVDLDTRARDGAVSVGLLRDRAPQTTVLALLPCGGLPPGRNAVPYHLSVEKPARLRDVMTALAASQSISRN